MFGHTAGLSGHTSRRPHVFRESGQRPHRGKTVPVRSPNRRRIVKRLTWAAFIAAFVLLASPASSQQAAPAPAGPDFAAVQIKTTDLGHRTYMLEGFGGNMTAAVTDAGVILVDGEFAPLHDKIKAAIAAISPQPVHFLINTHFHGGPHRRQRGVRG